MRLAKRLTAFALVASNVRPGLENPTCAVPGTVEMRGSKSPHDYGRPCMARVLPLPLQPSSRRCCICRGGGLSLPSGIPKSLKVFLYVLAHDSVAPPSLPCSLPPSPPRPSPLRSLCECAQPGQRVAGAGRPQEPGEDRSCHRHFLRRAPKRKGRQDGERVANIVVSPFMFYIYLYN